MKTTITNNLESDIWKATNKRGVFGCFEVTIGWYGNERVDYLTYDTKGIWRCYEIKSSKSDFYSKSAKTFVGHFNYFVLTKELYDIVGKDISDGIGVYFKDTLVKRAKKRELLIDEQILKNSLIRSLYRYAEGVIESGEPSIVDKYIKDNKRLQSDNRDLRRRNHDMRFEISKATDKNKYN